MLTKFKEKGTTLPQTTLLAQYGATTEKSVFAENTHVFEFSPEEWKLIFQFGGWKVKYERIYYQYPRKNKYLEPFYRKFWKEFDFEGFYGVVLEKDDTYKNLYGDWG